MSYVGYITTLKNVRKHPNAFQCKKIGQLSVFIPN